MGQREHIVAVLRQNGPLTRNEISRACKLPIQSVCARVAELLESGRVRVAGSKLDTASPTKRPRINDAIAVARPRQTTLTETPQ